MGDHCRVVGESFLQQPPELHNHFQHVPRMRVRPSISEHSAGPILRNLLGNSLYNESKESYVLERRFDSLVGRFVFGYRCPHKINLPSSSYLSASSFPGFGHYYYPLSSRLQKS